MNHQNYVELQLDQLLLKRIHETMMLKFRRSTKKLTAEIQLKNRFLYSSGTQMISQP